jgi:heme-degrading monooxygenase HmoA
LIVRVLQGHVRPGQTAVFRKQALDALEDARRHDGLVYAQVGRQAHSDGSEEIVFVSVWLDLEALYTWLGGKNLLDTPVATGVSPDAFERFEVQHYEAFEGGGTEAFDDDKALEAASPDSGG